MKIVILISLFILSSCTTSPSSRGFKKRELGKYFIGTGVQRYMLSDLPDWANYSTSGRCKRESKTTYFKLKELKESFGMSHMESLLFQMAFNEKRRDLLKGSSLLSLPLKTEENLFFETTNEIKSGIFPFKGSEYKEINLVWVDHSLQSKDGINKLTELMKSEAMNEGFPIFVSFCHSASEVENKISGLGIFKGPIRVMSSDLLSIFNEKGKNLYQDFLALDAFFNKKQKLTFYSSWKWAPIEIKKRMKVIKY